MKKFVLLSIIAATLSPCHSIFSLEDHGARPAFEKPFAAFKQLQFLKSGDPFEDWKSNRLWTSTDGKTVSATLLESGESDAEFLLSNGNKVRIPYERLTEDDQRFIREWEEVSRYFNLNFVASRSITNTIEAGLMDGAFAKSGKVHETAHFRFQCDTDLHAEVVKDFSRLFEATYTAVESLPLALKCYEPEGGKFLVRLFSDKQDYYSQGGSEDAAGVYLLKEQTILVPLESLGLRSGPRGYTKDREYDPRTLIHETVHAVTHHWLDSMPMWMIEGLAEYVSAIPYKDGTLRMDGHSKGLFELAQFKFGGDAYRFTLRDPDELVALSHQAFMMTPEPREEPIVLDPVQPFQIRFVSDEEETNNSEGGMSNSTEMTGIKGVDLGGGLVPYVGDPSVEIAKNYVSSMLLVDHLIRSGQALQLRNYLFSTLHFDWDRKNYLDEYVAVRKDHEAKVLGQIKTFEEAIAQYNAEIRSYNYALDQFNAGAGEAPSTLPVEPVIPKAIPVPAILKEPRAAEELSYSFFRKNSPGKSLKLPASLAPPAQR